MKPILPEDRREWQACAKEIDQLISDETWAFRDEVRENLTLVFNNCSAEILTYAFPREAGFHYLSEGNVYPISSARFAEFSRQVLALPDAGVILYPKLS